MIIQVGIVRVGRISAIQHRDRVAASLIAVAIQRRRDRPRWLEERDVDRLVAGHLREGRGGVGLAMPGLVHAIHQVRVDLKPLRGVVDDLRGVAIQHRDRRRRIVSRAVRAQKLRDRPLRLEERHRVADVALYLHQVLRVDHHVGGLTDHHAIRTQRVDLKPVCRRVDDLRREAVQHLHRARRLACATGRQDVLRHVPQRTRIVHLHGLVARDIGDAQRDATRTKRLRHAVRLEQVNLVPLIRRVRQGKRIAVVHLERSRSIEDAVRADGLRDRPLVLVEVDRLTDVARDGSRCQRDGGRVKAATRNRARARNVLHPIPRGGVVRVGHVSAIQHADRVAAIRRAIRAHVLRHCPRRAGEGHVDRLVVRHLGEGKGRVGLARLTLIRAIDLVHANLEPLRGVVDDLRRVAIQHRDGSGRVGRAVRADGLRDRPRRLVERHCVADVALDLEQGLRVGHHVGGRADHRAIRAQRADLEPIVGRVYNLRRVAVQHRHCSHRRAGAAG